MLKIKALILLIFIQYQAFSQVQYGNEWINFNQKYLKIKITENGVYRINKNQLNALNFLDNNTDPRRFQVFTFGKEIPLIVKGESDGKFDDGDYIEFYAKKNSGESDKILYSNANHQPNEEVSLFSDESSYFLTLNSTQNGLRYTLPVLSNTPLSAEGYMVYTSRQNFSEKYYPGLYVLDVMTFSDYIEGEGYMATEYGLGGNQIKTLNTPGLINASFSPRLEFYVAGRSNAASTNIQGRNHHLNISINNNILFDTLFRGYQTIRKSINLNYSDIANTTPIKFSSINDLGALTDFQAIAYAQIQYPRSFDASNYQTLSFSLNTNNVECQLNFTNYNGGSPTQILDYKNAYFYQGNANGNNVSFRIKNQSQDAEYFIYNESSVKPAVVENTTFKNLNFADFQSNMILITHSSLLNSVNELGNYKRSKGVKTQIITSDDLYNEFYYGIRHPLAIRNYVRYILEKSSFKPEYLFLVGKGTEYSKQNLVTDLIPSMGFPPSDINYSSKIIDNSLAPALATGRLPAKNNQEVLDYLDKIKLYDLQPNEFWRKNIINISGGGNNIEDITFSRSLNNFSNISSKEFFGSKTVSYYKKNTDPITTDLVGKINSSIENGASLLTYLGHGSTISTAVSIGNPNNINNKEKLLFYYINGCSTGNSFANTSLGENYIFQKEKGAIGWIGTSSEGVESYLTNYGNQFYTNNFKTNYGKSVAQNLSFAIKNVANENDALSKIHAQQYIYLGDPSLSFYSPNKSDYEVNNTSLGILESNITANSSNFTLTLIVRNIGKAILNPLKIQVSRTLSDNTLINYPLRTYPPVFNTDTLLFTIDNNITKASGINKFTIKLDPNNEIDELNESNNTVNFDYFLPSNGITITSPYNNGIVSSQNPELKVQANNLFTKNAEYLFEIDTIETFSSSWKKSSGIINSNLFTIWRPGNILENNKVYYWRAKLNQPNVSLTDWQTSSFTYIENEASGFSQSHYQQFKSATLTNIIIDSRKFDYTKTAYPIFIQTRGNNETSNRERRLRVSISVGALSFNSNNFTGFALAAFEPINSRKTFSYPSPYNFSNDGVTKTGQFFYNTNNQTDLDSMARYLSQIPKGYYVVGLSGINFSGKDLPSNIKTLLQELGLNEFNKVNFGEPYIFVAEKGKLNSSLFKEITANYNLSTPANAQYISLNTDLPNNFNSGIYQSEKIGPSTSWKKVFFNFIGNQNDIITNEVIGIDNNGAELVLKSNLNTSEVDISDLNAANYPYIKLKSYVTDNTEKTVAQLTSWKVIYDQYSDYTFNPEVLNVFHSNSLDEGDSIRLKSAISSYGKISNDSISLRYKIIKSDRTVETGLVKKLPAFTGNSNFDFNYSTINLIGENLLQLSLEGNSQKDLFNFNNIISYPFTVNRDIKTPLIDVLFDGRHIVNGETVSPMPSVNITVKDENKFLILNDTSAIELSLKKDNGDFKRIFFSSNKIAIKSGGTNSNNLINYEFLPDILEDGKYTLKIKSMDKSNNALSTDYLTEFEVINEQTISNFLPYPNPVVNTSRFVFKITGLTIPDKIRIQISSSSGKIVRVINKNELGNLRIGNNISDFEWDGTDQFGERLANGVYFYQVFVENNDGIKVENKSNQASQYFEKNIGKIYLMR